MFLLLFSIYFLHLFLKKKLKCKRVYIRSCGRSLSNCAQTWSGSCAYSATVVAAAPSAFIGQSTTMLNVYFYIPSGGIFQKISFQSYFFPFPQCVITRARARTLLACGHTRYGSKVQKGLEHNTKQVGGKAFKTVTVAIHTPNAYRTYLKHIIQPDDNYVRLSLKYHVEVDDIKRVRHSLPLRVLIYLCTYEWCVRVRVNIFFLFI